MSAPRPTLVANRADAFRKNTSHCSNPPNKTDMPAARDVHRLMRHRLAIDQYGEHVRDTAQQNFLHAWKVGPCLLRRTKTTTVHPALPGMSDMRPGLPRDNHSPNLSGMVIIQVPTFSNSVCKDYCDGAALVGAKLSFGIKRSPIKESNATRAEIQSTSGFSAKRTGYIFTAANSPTRFPPITSNAAA